MQEGISYTSPRFNVDYIERFLEQLFEGWPSLKTLYSSMISRGRVLKKKVGVEDLNSNN